jgi:glycosyltransferase involved in cell wall biosynthesis
MYNLMRRASGDYDHVLVCFSPNPDTPPRELLDLCCEVTVVKLWGSHSRPSSERPEVVEEFDSPAFHAALRMAMRKWRPAVAQLEFTQMAQYAADCAPAPTLMVEHDVTFDLYTQLAALSEDWELRRQLDKWRRFETEAWREVSCVVTMSEKDRRMVSGARRAEALPNGVDLERYRPSGAEPEPGRLLFIGSFAHLPNLLALEFFLKEIRPLLAPRGVTLHAIAGMRHEYFLEFYKDRVAVDLTGVELEGFVADVRPAYERAAVVIAPLRASAGTNIKILEAMAMGKAVVSTSAGVNGLDIGSGEVVVRDPAREFAAAILELLDDPAKRQAIEKRAREAVERRYDWNVIAARQKQIYRSLAG